MRSTARPANVLSACCATARRYLFDVARRYNIDAEEEQAGWVQPVHSPGRIKIAERRVRQWSKFGAPVELLSREQTRDMLGSDAWFGGFWNKTGGHINPLALARGLARTVLGLGARIYARSPAKSFERRNDRWVVKTAKGEICGRALVVATNAYSGEFSKSLVPDDCARGDAGAVLADGDAAFVRQCPQDHHSRPAGDVGYPWRTLFRALRRAKPSRHRRRGDRPRQQGRADQGARHRAAAAAVAADRRSLLRLRLERLCRHDHGFPAAHPQARAQRLWLDRLQRPRGGADDPARQ